MRALSLLALAACGHAAPAAQTAPRDRSFDDVILAGVPATFDDACYSGPIWGAVDADVGRQRLDAAFAKAAKAADHDARNEVCSETLAIARLRRAERTHTLDLTAELGHSTPRAREVAARYAITATPDAAAGAKLRDLLGDADVGVRIEAHRAVAAHHDRDAIPVLQWIAARRDDARPLACATLRKLGAPGDCEPDESGGGGLGLLTGSGPVVDYCAEARANIASPDVRKQREGMLFFVSEQFGASSKDLTSFPEAHASSCLLAPAERERMMASPDRFVRALAAATTVWSR